MRTVLGVFIAMVAGAAGVAVACRIPAVKKFVLNQ